MNDTGLKQNSGKQYAILVMNDNCFFFVMLSVACPLAGPSDC